MKNYKSIYNILNNATFVPVITINDPSKALPLARALMAGGLYVMEITLRTTGAFEVAEAIVNEIPEAIVGLGTVLRAKELERAIQSGFAFALSPGCSVELLNAAKDMQIPYAPGVHTASDVMECVVHGFETAKFFPAVTAGGLAMLRALSGPFPTVRFCPTGGLKKSTVGEWLVERNVIAVGGSWVTPEELVDNEKWSEITALARETITYVKRLRNETLTGLGRV